MSLIKFCSIHFTSLQSSWIWVELCLVQFFSVQCISTRFQWIQFCAVTLQYITLRWSESGYVQFRLDEKYVAVRHVTLSWVRLGSDRLRHVQSSQVMKSSITLRPVRLGTNHFVTSEKRHVTFNKVTWSLVKVTWVQVQVSVQVRVQVQVRVRVRVRVRVQVRVRVH